MLLLNLLTASVFSLPAKEIKCTKIKENTFVCKQIKGGKAQKIYIKDVIYTDKKEIKKWIK
jgi:hypothetical protein